MSNEPRNVDDVPCVESADGAARPMREVLDERKRRANTSPRRVREAAFHERAFIQGQLGSCLCSWPLEKAETESGHPEWCPAHHLLLSKNAQEKLPR